MLSDENYHYQLPPHAQGKLVRVVQGKVFDVAVDIRKSSSTYGKFESFILSEENSLQLWVPPGFAHGFLAISESVEFLYKCTNYWDKSDEKCISYNDHHLNIPWPHQPQIIHDRDRAWPLFADLKSEERPTYA